MSSARTTLNSPTVQPVINSDFHNGVRAKLHASSTDNLQFLFPNNGVENFGPGEGDGYRVGQWSVADTAQQEVT